MKEYIAEGLAVVVIIAWMLAIVGGIIRRDWTAVNIITPVLLTVAGWLYIRRNGKEK
jgi:hypothetical protein